MSPQDSHVKPVATKAHDLIARIWIVLTIACVAGSFLYLDRSSLWLDELFTVYFADPEQKHFASFLARASEDVHPPVYYMVVWLIGRLTDADMTIVIRSVSAVSGAIALGLLYWAQPDWVHRSTWIFCCTFAATSSLYFRYAQEGRSYSLTWIVALIMIGIAFRVLRSDHTGKSAYIPVVALACAGTIGGLTHAYMIPVAGALIFMLLVLTKGTANRIALIIAGLSILAVNVAYIGWHSDRIVADVTNTWFGSSGAFLAFHSFRGLDSLMRSDPEHVFFVGLVVIAAMTASARQHQGRVLKLKQPYVRDPLFMIGTFALSILFVILITLFYIPSYSFRFFIVLAPFYWIIAGFMFELIRRHSTPSRLLTVGIVATITFAVLTTRIGWRQVPSKEPWRETAEFVSGLPDCRTSALPVVVFETPYILSNEADIFYGYYMPDSAEPVWLPYSRLEIASFPEADPEIETIVADRIAGRDACPLLLWGVFHSKEHEIQRLKERLKTEFAFPAGTSLVVEQFMLPWEPGIFRYSDLKRVGVGHVLMVKRTD